MFVIRAVPSRLVACLTLVPTLAMAAPSAAEKQRCIAAAEEGQQLRQDGKLGSAAERFRECAAVECPKVLQKDCSAWLGEVQDARASVVIHVDDEEGHPVQNAHVTMDGLELATEGDRPVTVDPGVHRFVWVREGQAAIETTLTLQEAERAHVVTLSAPRRAIAKTAPTRSSRSISPLVWIGYGLGTAAIGTGAGFWVWGLDQRSTLQDRCGRSGTCSDSDVNASRGNLIVGDVMMGVGLVALAGATYFLVRELTRTPDPLLDARSGMRLSW